MSTPTPQTHLVVLPLQAWGHARPLTALVARIAQTGPLTITFFTPKHLYQRIKTELSRHFDGPRSLRRARIRIVALPADEENALDLHTFFASFTDAYNKLAREETVTCVHSGVTMHAVRAPDAVILDIFAYSVTVKIRKTRPRVKVFCYTPCGAFATYRILYLALEQNEHRNLNGYRQRLECRAYSNGTSLEDVAQKEFMSTRGRVIRPHGLPAMYDYENYPQEVRQTRLSPLYHLHIIEHMVECDGIITSGPACLEAPEGLSRLSAWLAQTSRSLYVVGPLQPVGNFEHAAAQEKTLSNDARKIDAFMERVLKKRGERSMIFMSFGSLFWPLDSSKVWAFVDVLLDKRIPFIFSHSAQYASVPESVTRRVRHSDLGLLTSWAPQQAVLAHKATGWFVTHAGFNSVMESVTAGVPMICWPFRAEQPTNTLHVTHNLDIAYELFEVRTGPDASRPIFTLGRAPRGTLDAVRAEACAVLERAFGADGERKRANVRRMKADALAAWAEGGSASEAVKSLVGAFKSH